MKFGKYLADKQTAEWSDYYVDYKALKDLIKEASQELALAPQQYSPRTTSLTVIRAADRRDTAEERFFKLLESEVDKVGQFTAEVVDKLRERLFTLQQTAASRADRDALNQEAKAIGDEFLQLEKYVNMNYMAFHKILKKHDKNLPHSPCRQFYISHLHNQPWVQGNYSDLLMALSNLYSEIRGDQPGPSRQSNIQSEVGLLRYTKKYWVRMSDVSGLKNFILQHLPVYQFSQGDYAGDSELMNSVYLDNSSLETYHARLDRRPNSSAIRVSWFDSQQPTEVSVERQVHKESWTGEEDIDKEDKLMLPEEKVVDFLEGQLTPEQVLQYWRTKGDTEEELQKDAQLFEELQTAIDAKQLKPMVRTQCMRTSFMIPFDPTVRIYLDTNVCMIKENPEDGPSCAIAGRWYRDPSIPIQRTEITRFPHAVLELQLALPGEHATPAWVEEMIETGWLTEIDRFSKFIHGTATLFPDMVQAVPYWVDDESVRASMLISAPDQPTNVAPTARDQPTFVTSKPRKGQTTTDDDDLQQPLLSEFRELGGARRAVEARKKKQGGLLEWWFSKPEMASRPKVPGVDQRAEPKTYFANERTFLSWMHMAITIGSVATAMLGVSGGKEGAEIIPVIMLPVAIIMCGYALLVYHWRSKAIRDKTGLYFDDRRGPLALSIMVVSSLSLIFLISLIDFIHTLKHKGEPDLGWLFG